MMIYISILVLMLANISNGRTMEDRILVETLPGRHPMVPYTHMAIAKAGGVEANLIIDKDTVCRAAGCSRQLSFKSLNPTRMRFTYF